MIASTPVVSARQWPLWPSHWFHLCSTSRSILIARSLSILLSSHLSWISELGIGSSEWRIGITVHLGWWLHRAGGIHHWLLRSKEAELMGLIAMTSPTWLSLIYLASLNWSSSPPLCGSFPSQASFCLGGLAVWEPVAPGYQTHHTGYLGLSDGAKGIFSGESAS